MGLGATEQVISSFRLATRVPDDLFLTNRGVSQRNSLLRCKSGLGVQSLHPNFWIYNDFLDVTGRHATPSSGIVQFLFCTLRSGGQ